MWIIFFLYIFVYPYKTFKNWGRGGVPHKNRKSKQKIADKCKKLKYFSHKIRTVLHT